jgi:hypothetical protein
MIEENEIKAGDVIKASGILWDTDDGNGGTAIVALPDEVTITIPDGWSEGDSVADLISDEHGFCIDGIRTLERV